MTLPVNSRCTSPYHFSIGSSYRLKNLNIVRSTHLLVGASFVFRVIKRVHGFCYCLMYLCARSGWSIFAKYRRIYMYICIQIELHFDFLPKNGTTKFSRIDHPNGAPYCHMNDEGHAIDRNRWRKVTVVVNVLFASACLLLIVWSSIYYIYCMMSHLLFICSLFLSSNCFLLSIFQSHH